MMNEVSITLQVFFDDPFWVGIFEIEKLGELFVSRVVFGAEPRDVEVYEFVLRRFHSLKHSPAIAIDTKKKDSNFKKKQRNARKAMQVHGIGTKSQQALKLQQEQMKKKKCMDKQAFKKKQKEEVYALKQSKKKAKHKGR